MSCGSGPKGTDQRISVKSGVAYTETVCGQDFANGIVFIHIRGIGTTSGYRSKGFEWFSLGLTDPELTRLESGLKL